MAKNTKIYIVIHNNGESYEDRSDWNSLVCMNEEQAITHAKNNAPDNSYDFSIEVWSKEKHIETIEFEKNREGNFEPSYTQHFE